MIAPEWYTSGFESRAMLRAPHLHLSSRDTAAVTRILLHALRTELLANLPCVIDVKCLDICDQKHERVDSAGLNVTCTLLYR